VGTVHDGPPLRILFVNDRSPVGGSGAEIHLARLADALRAAGHEVRLFAGNVVHSGVGRVLDVWDPGARRRLRALVESFRPDVVHYHNVTRELSGSVLGVAGSAARVLTIHDPRILGVPDGPAGAPIDPQPLRVATRSRSLRAAMLAATANLGRRGQVSKVSGLLRRFSFTTLANLAVKLDEEDA